jgi:hypothetical protein
MPGFHPFSPVASPHSCTLFCRTRLCGLSSFQCAA